MPDGDTIDVRSYAGGFAFVFDKTVSLTENEQYKISCKDSGDDDVTTLPEAFVTTGITRDGSNTNQVNIAQTVADLPSNSDCTMTLLAGSVSDNWDDNADVSITFKTSMEVRTQNN